MTFQKLQGLQAEAAGVDPRVCPRVRVSRVPLVTRLLLLARVSLVAAELLPRPRGRGE